MPPSPRRGCGAVDVDEGGTEGGWRPVSRCGRSNRGSRDGCRDKSCNNEEHAPKSSQFGGVAWPDGSVCPGVPEHPLTPTG